MRANLQNWDALNINEQQYVAFSLSETMDFYAGRLRLLYAYL
jgi:hypothetical protein